MRKFLLGIVTLALIAGQATAADLPVKAPVYKAPPPVAVFSWTGFYVGANIGYTWGRSSNDWNFFSLANGGGTVCQVPGAAPPNIAFCAAGSDSNRLNGAIGGLQAGYNWQTGNYLVGIETDFQISGQKGDQTFFPAAPSFVGPPITVSAGYTEKLLWLGTLRGRAGITFDRWLAYATGGLAYGRVTSDGSATATGLNAGQPGAGICVGPGATICPLGAWSNSVTKAGWTVGGGVEGAIGDGWSLKVEYLYVDLGKVSTSFATLPGCFGPAGGGCAFERAGSGTITSRITDNIIRVGLNYRFGGPVVARY